MRALTANDLVRISEVTQHQNPLDQALTILQFAFPELDRETLADLTVNVRDAQLLKLREHTLGPEIKGRAECPQCCEYLEFVISTADLEPEGDHIKVQHNLERNDLRLELRMATSRDLFDLLDIPLGEGRRLLAKRCIVNIERQGGEKVSFDLLPDALIEEVGKQLCDGKPGAETLVHLGCPACGNRWELTLDIGSFFAKEIEMLAKRLLLEVHALARAYGWTEREVLSLAARRRRAYLELVGHA